MDDLFSQTVINRSVSVEPKYITNSLNDIILKKLKDQYEEKCSKDGYIKKNSIRILKRSLGKILASQFNGNVLYNVKFAAEICNPLEGAVITAQVSNINKMGVLATVNSYSDSPLNIILARQHHVDNDKFATLTVGTDIEIKILGKRFEYGDTQISIIAVLESVYDTFANK